MAKEFELKEKKYAVVALLIVGLIYLGAIINYPVQNVDEFSSLAAPVILAGGNWTDIMKYTRWHGWGVTIFLTPLYAMGFDGIFIYRCSLGLCLLCRLLMLLLTHYISTDFLKVDYKKSWMIAVLCSIGILEPSDGRLLSNMTEIPITLVGLVWTYLIGILICRENKKELRRASMLLPICVVYSFSIHSRSVVMLLAMGISALPFWKTLLKKIEWKLFFLCTGLSIKYYFLLNNLINELLYSGVSGGNNTVSNVVLLAPERIIKHFGEEVKILKIFFSIFSAYTFYSLGFFTIILSINIYFIFRCIKRRNFDFLFWSSSSSVLSWLFMNLGISIQNVEYTFAGKYAWMTYLRYSLPFMWMMIVCALVFYYKEIINTKLIVISECMSIVSIIYFMTYTVRILEESGYEMSNTLFRRLWYYGESARDYYNKLFIIWLAVQLIFIFSIIMNNRKWIIITYLLFSVLYIVNREYESIKQDYVCNDSIKIIEYLTENYNSHYTIRYAGSESYAFSVRSALYDTNIRYLHDLNKLSEEDLLVMSQQPNSDVEAYVTKITDNCYLVSREIIDKDLIKALIEVGIRIEE